MRIKKRTRVEAARSHDVLFRCAVTTLRGTGTIINLNIVKYSRIAKDTEFLHGSTSICVFSLDPASSEEDALSKRPPLLSSRTSISAALPRNMYVRGFVCVRQPNVSAEGHHFCRLRKWISSRWDYVHFTLWHFS
ncbi:uncharacterized protein LOC120358916 isoform X1 [Solenopsis invicta]|uniref:uncharacterized protein LOC120358916 isoform X1 n=1 Tax=Solenopsis invicta TaxID=13686 RepID=UPI00193E239D|nr:uncharacterized protein LOC120358916 isoform X1 [Solenopsis invicta]